jgi:hypothetical protein
MCRSNPVKYIALVVRHESTCCDLGLLRLELQRSWLLTTFEHCNASCLCSRSWNIPRAVKYREINKITGLRGTAVNVQTMVYGNINDNSGTGGFVCVGVYACLGDSSKANAIRATRGQSRVSARC